jgi:hypothetical protein
VKIKTEKQKPKRTKFSENKLKRTQLSEVPKVEMCLGKIKPSLIRQQNIPAALVLNSRFYIVLIFTRFLEQVNNYG